MRIAFITTPTRTYLPNTVLPLGVMYLGAYMKKLGHNTKVFDVARTRQPNDVTVRELEGFAPDVIAISGIITSYAFVKLLTADLRSHFPTVPIVIGGHITIDNAEEILRTMPVDYAVIGYGELVLQKIVEHIGGSCSVSDIPAIYYRDGGVIRHNEGTLFFKNIDEIPYPDYELVDMEYYVTIAGSNPKLGQYIARTGKVSPPARSAFVVGALGCTDRCTFCVHEFEHKGFYTHSIGYVIGNIRILYERYGVRVFNMGEDLFLYNPGQARDFSAAMSQHFPDAYFSCSIRADYVTRELLDALKGSNCAYLVYGFESGSAKMLDMLGKRMSPAVNIQAYRLISGTDITPGCSFMVGTPGETRETVNDTMGAIEAAGIYDSAVFFTTPYPGSRLFRWSVEAGMIQDTDVYLETVSNRDANILTINFTPYPDSIVKLMRLMLLNALERNKALLVRGYRIPWHKYALKHVMAPFAYNAYFVSRKLFSWFVPALRRDTLVMDLKEDGTVRLRNEAEGRL